MKRLLWLSGIVTIAACTTLLGDDFTIVAGAGGSGANGGDGTGGPGAGGNTGGGGTGGGNAGGGGAVNIPPMDCSWIPDSVFEVKSYAGESPPTLDDQSESIAGDNHIVAVFSHGSTTDLFSVDENGLHADIDFPLATQFYGAKVVDAQRASILLGEYRQALGGWVTKVLVFSKGDRDLANRIEAELHQRVDDIDNLEADYIPFGDGDAADPGTFGVVVSYRSNADNTFRVGVLRPNTTDSPRPLTIFHEDASGSLPVQSFEPNSMFVTSNDSIHLILGDKFDGGNDTEVKQYLLPVNPPLGHPEERIVPGQALGFSKRSTTDYSAWFLSTGMDGSINANAGTLTESELTTIEAESLNRFDGIAASDELPINGEQRFTDDGLVVIGRRDNQRDKLGVLIVHNAVGTRTNAVLEWQDATMFPMDFRIRVANFTFDEGFFSFDDLGGKLRVLFVGEHLDHDRVYYGEINCTPQ